MAAAENAPILELDSVTSGYGRVVAVDAVSLVVHPGEFVALLGPNGAGKSTLLQTISGLVRVKSGSIRVQGKPVEKRSAARIARLGIAHVPEGRRLFAQLSVFENLQLGGYGIRGDKQRFNAALDRVYSLFPILEERATQVAGTVSGGQGQMLAIGRALMSDPRILILDEPSLGLAPAVVMEIFAHLRKLNDDGLTILLVEQAATLALDTADRAYLLDRGRVTLEGTCAQIAGTAEVQKVYFGAGE